MSLKSRNKPTGNQVELEFTIEKEAFDKAVDAAYRKNVGKMNDRKNVRQGRVL